jgi:hypothetical protein
LVSKTWAAEAARHLELDGASIDLELNSNPDSPDELRDRELQRLQSLADWLRQYGHLLCELRISVEGPPDDVKENMHVLEVCQVMPIVVDALAAAGRRPGGLRLEGMCVPVLPGTPIFTICRALSGCHQLQALALDNSYSGQTTKTSWSALMALPAALQQLTQLTWLRLDGGIFHYHGEFPEKGVDGLFKALPSSLVILELGSQYQGFEGATVNLCTSSLQHLVALEKLVLPHDTCITDSGITSSGGSSSAPKSDPLAGLTALTYLKCYNALQDTGAPLLALPNLATLSAVPASAAHLDTLSRLSGLRVLDASLDVREYREQAEALEALTQLTALAALVQDPDGFSDEEWLDDGEEVEDVMLEAAAGWGRALSSLPRLCMLYVEPVVLQEMTWAALTALTCLRIDCKDSQEWHDQEQLDLLLGSLTPMRGRLQQVRVLYLPDELQVGCEAALVGALGDVEVEFV